MASHCILKYGIKIVNVMANYVCSFSMKTKKAFQHYKSSVSNTVYYVL